MPKVWKVDGGEVAIWQGLGLPRRRATRIVRAVGAVEAAFAVATIARSSKRWPFVTALAAMPTLAIGAAKDDRSLLTKVFNPASLGLARRLPRRRRAGHEGRPPEWPATAAACFRIEVQVANRILEPLFGYRGSFTVEGRPCPAADVPAHIRPLREAHRE